MYAIVKAGGKQYKVAQNDIIEVNKLKADVGENIELDQVLLVNDDNGLNLGTPYVTGAKVIGKVMRQFKGKKINGFTYKPKKDYRRRYGHRQLLTAVKIEEIKVS
ncbi:MAG: 50S ribosomal protein L21 [Armatimonadota bacterium]